MTMTHLVRNCYTDVGIVHAAVTLPTVPGVTVTTDRSDTAPTMPTIRTARKLPSPAGVALRAAAMRRVQWVREALMDSENTLR